MPQQRRKREGSWIWRHRRECGRPGTWQWLCSRRLGHWALVSTILRGECSRHNFSSVSVFMWSNVSNRAASLSLSRSLALALTLSVRSLGLPLLFYLSEDDERPAIVKVVKPGSLGARVAPNIQPGMVLVGVQVRT
eukprot:COSAG05_NODE_39_length_27555_cov_750.282925_22_plen_136_part_00